ncbi:MAG: hypothetical protein IRZ32_16710, partial [Solirubrobacteraceae bacterium]|nr:hypothetical protein [Solirubrobacteraceae bacterium]
MSPLDDLTPDQRAVLQLLLRQGKTYGELAALLRIDPDAVRRRAIDAVAALGPDLDPEGRDVLTDWLLGQLDDERSAHARDLLNGSTAALEWAAAVSVRLAEAGLEPRGALPAVEPDPEPEAEAAAEGADAGAQASAGAPPAGPA